MKHRFPSLPFVALCGLAPAGLGTVLNWSAWLWGFMSVVTTSGALLLVLTVLSAAPAPVGLYDPVPPEPPAPPAEQPYAETRVVDAALPSAADDYDFVFSATVWWRPVSAHPDQPGDAFSGLAVSSILSRALEVTRREDPGRAPFARYLLEGELSIPVADRSGRVQSLAADVTLALAPADRERLRKMNDLRKDEELWENERQHERNKRRYLSDDVLKSAGSAVVWWLARHDDDIEKTVDLIGPLAQLTAAANDEEVPELFRHLIDRPLGAPRAATVGGPPQSVTGSRDDVRCASDQVRGFAETLDLKPGMDEYTVLVLHVVGTLETIGCDEAAEKIRRTLLSPADGKEGDDAEAGRSHRGDPGPWSPECPSSEDSPFTDPDPDAGAFTPYAEESGADERDKGRDRSDAYDSDSPFSRFPSTPPDADRAQDAGDDDGS